MPGLRQEIREERREDRREERHDREERREERHDDRHEDRDHDRQHSDSSNSPVFHPGRMTKILISPGTGAGWITWAPRNATDTFLIWMLTYEPLIRGLERREHKDKLEDKVREFHREAHNRHGVERLNVARVGDIVVREVNYPFEVRENDGKEWIEDIRGLAGGVGGRRHINM